VTGVGRVAAVTDDLVLRERAAASDLEDLSPLVLRNPVKKPPVNGVTIAPRRIAPMGETYLLDNSKELDRLRLQSEVWEPAGRSLLDRLGAGDGRRALDVGCGALGWLRILSHAGWRTTGTDIDASLLMAAASLGLDVELVQDDIFDSTLSAADFDLVHARFQLAPLGRVEEQLNAYRRWLKPGGVLVLEEPESSSWRVLPEAQAVDELISRIRQTFLDRGGDFDIGRRLPELLGGGEVDAHVHALPASHPYLQLPLQFARSLGIGDTDAAEAELASGDRFGLTFTLVQAWRQF
jgi:SAM-dependent methyltransferase